MIILIFSRGEVGSEKFVSPFLADIDSIKMEKIKEAFDKAELTNSSGAGKAKTVKPKGAKAAAAAAAPEAKAASPPVSVTHLYPPFKNKCIA